MKESVNVCPCCSGKRYEECCKNYHDGSNPQKAEQLMRSRYSAYALNLPEYIVKTTHKKNPSWSSDNELWMKDISQFSEHTKFEKLEVLSSSEEGSRATVTFTAHLQQEGKKASFTEISIFEKVAGRWLYLSGKVKNI